MTIQNSTYEDISEIFRLYRLATELQKEKSVTPWPNFDRTMIEKEIKEKRQWKIVSNDTIACIWATTFTDPLIWQEKNSDPSVYIHRITTNPNYRGQHMVDRIVSWSKTYARQHQKSYIRMDTVGDNTGLIHYYTKCGFTFLGLSQLTDTDALPKHYDNAVVSLFEIQL